MQSKSVAVENIEDLQIATSGNRDFRPVQMGSHDVSGQLFASKFAGVTLTYGSFSSDIRVTGTYSNDQLSIALVLQADDIRCLGKIARPGDMVVAGKACENEGRYQSQLEYAVVNVDKADVLAAAEAHNLHICPHWLDGSDLFRLDDVAGTRAIQQMRFILGRLRNGSLNEIGLEAEKSLALDIVRLLTTSLSGAITSEPCGEAPLRRSIRLVPRIEEWLAANPRRVPRVDELADVLHVSTRQLYRAFRLEVEMSPARYLRHFRMTRARFDLLGADPAETTVTAVANSLGFWEMGRFAVEYRRLFGESPSQTLVSSR